jgi:hypothetical protein
VDKPEHIVPLSRAKLCPEYSVDFMELRQLDLNNSFSHPENK